MVFHCMYFFLAIPTNMINGETYILEENALAYYFLSSLFKIFLLTAEARIEPLKVEASTTCANALAYHFNWAERALKDLSRVL
jgi:hypothetical protein